MVNSELGTKRACPSCAAKFYDLNKSPVTCPKCGHGFSPRAEEKLKRAKPVDKPAKAVEAEIEEDSVVSLDAIRDDEIAADADADDDVDDDVDAEILGIEDEDLDDIDDEDDAFLEDDEEDADDVSGLVRVVGDEKEA